MQNGAVGQPTGHACTLGVFRLIESVCDRSMFRLTENLITKQFQYFQKSLAKTETNYDEPLARFWGNSSTYERERKRERETRPAGKPHVMYPFQLDAIETITPTHSLTTQCDDLNPARAYRGPRQRLDK